LVAAGWSVGVKSQEKEAYCKGRRNRPCKCGGRRVWARLSKDSMDSCLRRNDVGWRVFKLRIATSGARRRREFGRSDDSVLADFVPSFAGMTRLRTLPNSPFLGRVSVRGRSKWRCSWNAGLGPEHKRSSPQTYSSWHCHSMGRRHRRRKPGPTWSHSGCPTQALTPH
jgi:hypothetical protein